MNRLHFDRFIKYGVLLTISIILSEFGIGCYYACVLGSDPISVFVEGLSFALPLTVGQISTACNVILIILIILFERKHLGLNTVLSTFMAGPLIDLFVGILKTNFPGDTTSLAIKVVILVLGVLSFGVGLGLGIACNQGIGCFTFLPIFLSDISKIELKYTQIITDAMFFVIGVLLGGIWGVGTLAGVFLTGPVLDFTMKLVEEKIHKIGPIIETK